MPSYADEFAALHPELQQRVDSGPVRLTISRGDSYRGPDGQISFAEKWETEEIMDIELVSSIDAETDSRQFGNQQSQDDSLVDTIRQRFGKKRKVTARLRSFSLLVLDTNILLSTLPFIKTLVSQCLSRNVFALSNLAFLPSPIAIIIPHIVLSELDNLKTSSKVNVAAKARAANTWLLSALQTQKKQMHDAVIEGVSSRINIPESSWVLHVENTGHASNFGRDVSLLTPDEQIVRLCVSLKEQTGYEVSFCSDDINARTKAEIENLLTFSFKDIVESVREDNEELVKLADDLIEQWQDQVFESAEDDTINKMEEDKELNEAGGSSSTNINNLHFSNKRKINDSIDRANRTTQHSIFANQTPSTQRSRVKNSIEHQFQANNHQTNNSTDRTNNINFHQYPSDKSTASSMWAT